jgi:hypothetical protein
LSKVFPGTEFADDGSLIQPLILALVSEAGPGYYAVFADGGMNAAAGNEWLRARSPCSPGTSCKKPTRPGSHSRSRPGPCTTPCTAHDTTASSPRPSASPSKGAL